MFIGVLIFCRWSYGHRNGLGLIEASHNKKFERVAKAPAHWNVMAETKNKKTRRQLLKARRAQQSSKKAERRLVDRINRTPGAILVNEDALNLGYGTPDFIRRGYYSDQPFNCKDCRKGQVWTAAQQKWWYEVARAPAKTKAVRCRECRRKERLRVEASRKQTKDGLQGKRSGRT